MSFITSLGDWLRKVSHSFSDVSINGRNIVLTRHNGDTETITTQDTDTTYNNATQSNDGLMSATDKTKLDNLPAWSLANSAGRASGSMIYNTYLAMRGLDNTTVLTLAAAETGDASKGAKFYLYGAAAESRQGDFVLQAGSLTGYKRLIGKADGTLTWAGVSIINQNAFSNIKVNSTPITANNVTDTLELLEGTGITLTSTASSNAVKISVTSNTYAPFAHNHSDLPLTGGTMTGSIVSDSNYFVRRATNNEQLTLLGGSSGNALYGAKLALNGAEYGTPGGQFTLQAGNSSGYKQLIGEPDGTLTWAGSNVVTVEDMPLSSNVSTNPYTFKIKLPNGLMIQAYYSNAFQTDANSRITWTYAEAFTETPFIFVQKISASNSFNLYSWNKTRVIIRCNNMSGTTVGSGVTIAAMIFAIGRWK